MRGHFAVAVSVLLALGACTLYASLLDRIIITVGSDVITETQLEEELAITAFLNHDPPSLATGGRRAAAHRLVQQALISHDMRLAHFPMPEEAQVTRAVNRIVADHGLPSDYEAALANYGIADSQVRLHVRRQLATLRFIEYRFRPELNISDAELRAEYDRRMANWEQTHGNAPRPEFEASRAELRADLLEARTDKALDDWLSQTSADEHILYLDGDLKPDK